MLVESHLEAYAVEVLAMSSNDSLIKISDVVPAEFRSLFRYERFNAMQSVLLPQVLQSDVSSELSCLNDVSQKMVKF